MTTEVNDSKEELVFVHPLVILNVSDHWTRTKVQSKEPTAVYGALLGRFVGRHLTLVNTFEVKTFVTPQSQVTKMNVEFLNARQEQYKEVFPELEVVGWYCTGDLVATSDDAEKHQVLLASTDGAVLLKLNPVVQYGTAKLPIAVFDWAGVDSASALNGFRSRPFVLESEESERIGVDHVTRLSTQVGEKVTSEVAKSIRTNAAAVTMLVSKMQMIVKYLDLVSSGQLPFDHEIARECNKLCHRLSRVEPDMFNETFETKNGDVNAAILLAKMTQSCGSLASLSIKLNQLNGDRATTGAGATSASSSSVSKSRDYAPQCSRDPLETFDIYMISRRLISCRRLKTVSSRLFSWTNQVAENKVGLFGNDLLRSPESFAQLNKTVNENSRRIVATVVAGSTERSSVQLFDDLSNEICKAADLVECVRHLHSDQGIGDAAEESSRSFCQLVESLNTYTPLYSKLKEAKISEKNRMDEVDSRTLDLFLDDFEQSGVHLDDDKRAEFVRLSGEIFDAGSKFHWGCDKNVPVSWSDRRKYGLDTPELFSHIVHSHDREKRKFVYNTYYQHDNEQEHNIKNLITARHQLANLTGYESFAHRAQYNTLLGDYESAKKFLTGVIESCQSSLQQELAVLMDVQSQCEHNITKVGEWDLYYLTELYKDRAFGTKYQSSTAHFFTYNNLINGFSKLVHELYGVTLEEHPIKPGEIWDATIAKLAVVDDSNNILGHIYMDLDRRSSKSMGDCHYTVRCSKELPDGSWQTPIVVLSLTLVHPGTKNWRNVPINIHSAENLFHELGHAMHSMLGRTRYQHVAGTRCPQDFSEIPSNLMELFFYDINVLRKILSTASGETISVEDAAHIVSSRFAFSSLEVVQQAAYGLFDLELHGPLAEKIAAGRISSSDVFRDIIANALPDLDRAGNPAFQHRFHHLVQYGAKYYSYLVARSSASLIWNSQFKSDPFSREKGNKWAMVQSVGGGLSPSTLLGSILGQPPTSDTLITSLSEQLSYASNLCAINV